MQKKRFTPIEKEGIELRLLTEDDLSMTLAWRNQDNIRRWFIHSDKITPDKHREWFRKYEKKDNDFVFIIHETKTLKKPVGQISVYNIDWKSMIGEFGRLMIGEIEARGRGIAQTATELVMEFAFKQLGLDQVYLEVFSDNLPAISIYKKAGFIEVGTTDSGMLLMNINRNQVDR